MSKKAKVAGSVVAGFPSPAEQYLEPPLDLNELLVKRPAATYFVRVEGDSMIEAGIHDGDLLVVDRSLRPASGDVIIASVDGDFTVKTLRLGNRDEERGNRKKRIGNREEGIGKRDEKGIEIHENSYMRL
jgi:SOS-response transcriptional repressor LexA